MSGLIQITSNFDTFDLDGFEQGVIKWQNFTMQEKKIKEIKEIVIEIYHKKRYTAAFPARIPDPSYVVKSMEKFTCTNPLLISNEITNFIKTSIDSGVRKNIGYATSYGFKVNASIVTTEAAHEQAWEVIVEAVSTKPPNVEGWLARLFEDWFGWINK